MPKTPIKQVHRICQYMGVDPGQKGGFAFLSYDKKRCTVIPMPETEEDIFRLIKYCPSEVVHHALIERVHSMPQQSSQSGFTFGMGYGGLRMAMIACKIPFEEVTPRVWQKEFSIKLKGKNETKTQFKKRIVAKAQQLFPRQKGIDLRTADALLIAEYCRRKHEGILK